MKKTLGILFFTAVLLISCKSQNVKDKDSSVSKASTALAAVDKGSSDSKKTVNVSVIDKPIHLTKEDFLAKVMDYEKNPSKWVYKGKLPCIVDFYADWCAPCRITSPILEDLAKTYSGKITIYKVDVQKEQELASVFGIQGIPAFLYCPMNGNPSMTSGIARTPAETKAMFVKNIEDYLLKNKLSD